MKKEPPFRFGLISTSKNLIDKTKYHVSRNNIDLQVSLSAMDEAVPPAEQMEKDGIELIMAGSYTSLILMDRLNIPVIPFTYSTTSIIESLQKATQIGQKIMLPILHEDIEKTDVAEKLFGVKLDQLQYRDCKSAKELIAYAKTNKYDVVIGANVIIKYAKELGVPHIEIQRSNKIIKSTVEYAQWVAKTNREEKEKTRRYHCIIDSASDGIIAVDQQGNITTINKTARALLDVDDTDVVGDPLRRFFPKTDINEVLSKNRAVTDQLDKVNRKTFVLNHRPFEVDGHVAGCVSTFNEISAVIKAENKIRKSLSRGHIARYTLNDLLFVSDQMQDVVNEALQYAKTDSNLLISGETGTGKEILAHGIHNLSRRKKRPFVSLNCAALPEQLLESELFGYEEGAFTGTRKGGKPGLFELAHKGTIFLDEIGETPENVQVRLLRVLQEREIMRLGGDSLVPVDVRVIAASNRDLGREVADGKFREDLFFRVNILRVHIPPLRDRLKDIPILLEEFIRYFADKHGNQPIVIPRKNMNWLKKYSWPGNVRQLRNFTERLVLLSQHGFNHRIFDKLYSELAVYEGYGHARVRPQSKTDLKKQFERVKSDNEELIIKKALEEARYSRTKAAKLLGISRSTLWSKMKKARLK